MKTVIFVLVLFISSVGFSQSSSIVTQHIIELSDDGEKGAAAMLTYYQTAKMTGIEEDLLDMVSEYLRIKLDINQSGLKNG